MITINSSKRLSTLPKEVIIGLGLFFLAGFADGALTPIFPLWARNQVGLPTAAIGSLFACYAGGELLATPLVGGIADRVGRRPVLLVSSAGVGVGFALLFFAHSALAAAMTLILIGCFESVLHPTISTVIADKAPDLKRRYSFALTRVMSNAGRIAGPAIGALVAFHSLRSVFLCCAGAMLLSTLIVVLFLPETMESRPDKSNKEEKEEPLPSFRLVVRDRLLVNMLLWLLFLQISSSWLESVLPLYANGSGSLTASQVSLLFTYGAALIVLLQLLVSKVVQNASGFQLVLSAGLSLAAAFICLTISSSVPALIFGITVYSIAQMLLGPLIPSTVNELAPPRARATYMAASSVVSDLKDTAGPAVGTFLFSLSARVPWLIGIPASIGAAFALATVIKRHEARMDNAADVS